MTDIVISGSGLFTPPNKISNEELVAAYNGWADKFNAENSEKIAAGEVAEVPHSSAEFIEKASGIKSRYALYKEGILDIERMRPQFHKRLQGEIPEMVEMAVTAAKQALAEAGRSPEEVDLVIVAASNMQRPYPALAVEVQQELGAQGFAYDMNVACSSATFAVDNAANSIRGGSASVALIVNPEFTTPQLDYRNRDSHFIFGDVCTAMVLEKQQSCNSENAFKICGTKLKTQFSNNIRCDVSYIDHCVDDLSIKTPFFTQEGRKVFKELLPLVIDTIKSELSELAWDVSDIKRMWLHQANINMNVFAVKKLLGRDPEPMEAPLVLDEYANTASAGSVIAFNKYRQGLAAGDKTILCSFGAGYSIGCIALEKL